MELFVVRRPSGWASAKELEMAAAKAAHIGDFEMTDRVRWIRSYVVAEQDGRLGMFCIYEARDEAAIREHAREAGMLVGEIYPVATTLVMRADPMDRKKAA